MLLGSVVTARDALQLWIAGECFTAQAHVCCGSWLRVSVRVCIL